MTEFDEYIGETVGDVAGMPPEHHLAPQRTKRAKPPRAVFLRLKFEDDPMRITVNAPDKECAGIAMQCAQGFIAKKKDDDGTSDGWGYLPKGFNVYVEKKKNGNISATYRRAPIKIQEAA